MSPLILATRNAHKTEEIRHLLGHLYSISDVTTHPALPHVEETGSTFLENARLKALGISSLVPGLVLADDSGLEVDALSQAPGVYSSSFGGEEGNHEKNNARLRREMADQSQRSARFLCVLVLAKNGKEIANFQGSVVGEIARHPAGKEGFGYDPLFIPEGHSQTLAELGPEVKSTLSIAPKPSRTYSVFFPLIPTKLLDR